MEFEAYLADLQAGGVQHSSGTFTCDLKGMQQVLGRHQLARAEEYVLAVISAAVLEQAPTFRLEQKAGVTRLSWEGPALTPHQLQGILPSLGRKDSALAELAVALLSARRLGQVRLFSQLGQLRFRGDEVVIEASSEGGPNTFEIRRSGWRRWLPLAALEVGLLTRARYAPLKIVPQPGVGKRVSTSLALCFGEPPRDWLMASDWVNLPESPWGEGILFLGKGPWEIIRHGVSHSHPSSTPGMRVVWWSDRFPLDLSRQHFIDTHDLLQWKAWLVRQFTRETLARELHQNYPWLIDQALDDPQSPLLQAPLFRTCEGFATSLGTLQDFYAREGWLPVVSRPIQIAWDPHRVVITQSNWERELRRVFPNWVNLNGLEGRKDIPRLPPGEEYLVRMPLVDPPGEAGLRRYPTPVLRFWEKNRWKEQCAHPLGIDVSRSDAAGLHPVELYGCLSEIESRPSCSEALQWHRVACLLYLRHTLAKKLAIDGKTRDPLSLVLLPKNRVRLPRPNGAGDLSSHHLENLAQEVYFRSDRGQVTLRQLLDRKERIRICPYSWDPAAQSICSEDFRYWALRDFLRENALETVEGSLPLTSLAFRLMSGGGGPVELFRRLLLDPTTQAYRMVEKLGRRLEWLAATQELSDSQADLESVAAFLRQEPLWPGLSFNTPHLLLALCEETSLQSLGLRRELVLPQLTERGQLEAAEHWTTSMDSPGLSPEQLTALRSVLVVCYMTAAQWDKILELAPLLPPITAEYWRGVVYEYQGHFASALTHIEKLYQLDTHLGSLSWQAEMLMRMGSKQEALERLPAERDSYADLVHSYLVDDPQQALDLLDSALTKPYPVLDIWEQRGIRLAQLQRPEEARQSLARFLKARPDIYPRYNLEERLRQARQLHDQL